MDGKEIIGQVVAAVLYLAAQVLLFRHMVLFEGIAAPYVYIGFILLLPFETSSLLLLVIGFGSGLVMDVFYDTLGINTAACVALAYLRPVVVRLVTPRGGYEDNAVLSLQNMGLGWFLGYSFLLTLIHHLILFFVEASNWELFWFTLLKAFCSTLFTLLLLTILQYLFYTVRRR